MNKTKKLSITLLASCILVACGGGGSSGGHQQVVDKTEVKIEPKKSETLKPTVGNRHSINEQPKQKEDSSLIETGKSISLDSDKVKSTEDTAIDKQLEPKETLSLSESKKPAAQDSEKIVPTEVEPSTSTKDTIVDKQLDENVNESLPKLDIKKELSSRTVSDQTIWSHFSKNGGHHDANAWISINLDGKELMLVEVDRSQLNNKQIHTLRDIDGELVGYYGYAALSKIMPSPYHPEENIAKYKYMALQEAKDDARSIPNVDMTYRGTMYYALDTAPQQALEADVSANYKNANKSISIDIFGKAERSDWYLTTHKPQEVGSDGSVFAQLYTRENGKLIKAGQFDGGLYGKNGEILLGKAKNEDITKQENNWKGVIGATAIKDK
ncbi:hypothetical protein Q7381_09760 [Glaesserella parasuis]|nr:hypothetical protein [Glaesserella parasuis]MDP0120639.1 hypothetical protein [Glaesserella parasuis]